MRRTVVLTCALLALLAPLVLVSGCDDEGPAEKAGKKVDQAVEQTGDAVQEGMDKAGDTVENATDN